MKVKFHSETHGTLFRRLLCYRLSWCSNFTSVPGSIGSETDHALNFLTYCPSTTYHEGLLTVSWVWDLVEVSVFTFPVDCFCSSPCPWDRQAGLTSLDLHVVPRLRQFLFIWNYQIIVIKQSCRWILLVRFSSFLFIARAKSLELSHENLSSPLS